MAALTVGGIACLLFADIVAGLLRSRIRADSITPLSQTSNSES
ncbi:hypothetical protein QZH56_17990 [Streptomyces olivoreticuli]|nr:hypothetical protein [Streptomyces olivoreticuli]WKK27309.1 hypothetical protein QZH56_17990 [Streptomyces olivoreticuli]